MLLGSESYDYNYDDDITECENVAIQNDEAKTKDHSNTKEEANCSVQLTPKVSVQPTKKC